MGRASVLIVEADASIALDVKRLLEKAGYGVAAVVATGEEAISRARALRPDLVIMDMGLAGTMTGSEAARQIREELRVAVVYLMARAADETSRSVGEESLHDHVLKPVAERELIRSVRSALHLADLERQLTMARQALVAEQQRAEGVLAAIGDGVMILDEDFRIVYQNAALTGMFGYHVGAYCYEVCAYRKQVCDQCQAEAAFRDGQSHRSEKKFVTPAGELFIEVTRGPGSPGGSPGPGRR